MPRAERPRMAAYGVPTDPEGTLPWEWARQRLVRNRNYWVVTASAAGRPHALPVWGVWLTGGEAGEAGEGGESFWFSCAPDAQKVRNIRANPQVTVAVEDTVECVSVQGRARLAGPDEIDPMIAAYLPKYWPDEDAHEQMAAFLRSHAVVALRPERAFGIVEREDEFAARATRWVW